MSKLQSRSWARTGVLAALGALAAGTLAACTPSGASPTPSAAKPASVAKSSGKVLLVGSYDGIKGGYTTIQSAVDAAKPGDWVLVGPGDYHEDDDITSHTTPAEAAAGAMAGVLITTPHLHLRGMNRSTVIVDGDRAGAPMACDPAAKWQDFGVKGAGGAAYGRNGIVVYKANDVSVDNLTACNFLSGTGQSGNEIWWNGGAETGKIGQHAYEGSYLTATSTYYGGEKTAAAYGIFSSNTAGPGSWNQLYASNFNDSGAYVGACQQRCDMVIDHAWFEYNALGYSGTNSGGRFVVENSQFDHNQDGFDTNTQIAGDPPPPQDGYCLHRAISPITHTRSCWVFIHNYVHDNNYANVPAAGSASQGPTGTGMTISGGRNDTIMDNRFADNGAWGILFVPYPDSSTPPKGVTCAGTGGVELPSLGCIYDPEDDALLHNTFTHNGYFKNPSNSDYGQIVLDAGQPQNCFRGNVAPDGSAPSDLEKIQPTCGAITTHGNTGGPLLAQVLCDTGFGSCPADAKYPKRTKVTMRPLPHVATMPNPCAGVPTNAWCPLKVATTSADTSLAPGVGHHRDRPADRTLAPLALAGVGLGIAPVAASRRRRSTRRADG